MKRLICFAVIVLLFVCTIPVYAANVRSAPAKEKPANTASKDSDDSGFLKSGDIGFKFYSWFPYSGPYTNLSSSFFRTIGVGVDWRISSSIALEPGFYYFRKDKTDKVSGTTNASNTSTEQYYAPSLALFYYHDVANNVNIYFGPRVEYVYHNVKAKTPSAATNRYPATVAPESKQSEYWLGGIAVLGLKCMLNDSFGVFGDLGIGYFLHSSKTKYYYTDPASKYPTYEAKTKAKRILLASSYIGIVFYLPDSDTEKKSPSQKSGSVKGSAEKSDLLKAGSLGFKFYTAYPYPTQYAGNNASFYRNLGISIDYHVTSSIAIEPGFIYYYSNTRITNSDSYATDTTYDEPYYGASLGLFYYYNTGTNLYIYSGPRLEFGYRHEIVKGYNANGGKLVYSDYYYGAIAVFGLKCMFNENIGVFGDIGLGYYIRYYHDKRYTISGEQISEYKTTEKQITFSSANFGITLYL